MTQDEVLQHCLDRDCNIYDKRTKEDGDHYFVRRNGTKKMVVVYPVADGAYTEFAVCHVCDTLGIELPNYAVEYAARVKEVKAKAELISKFPPPGSN